MMSIIRPHQASQNGTTLYQNGTLTGRSGNDLVLRRPGPATGRTRTEIFPGPGPILDSKFWLTLSSPRIPTSVCPGSWIPDCQKIDLKIENWFWNVSKMIRYFYDDWDCLKHSKTNHTIIVLWMITNIQEHSFTVPNCIHYRSAHFINWSLWIMDYES